MSKHKRPRLRKQPQTDKTPRSRDFPSVKQQCPTWSFAIMDDDGPWCFYRCGVEGIRLALVGLRPFETMTWAEIEGRRDHFVKRRSIIRDAQRRLELIRKDDVDDLFSLHLGGKPRVWGIRAGSVLRLLWWDPEHEICPSRPK